MYRYVVAALLFTSLTAVDVQARGPAVYRGNWNSQSTGHQGPMRLRLTPRRDGNYNARFTGRFAMVIPFTYRVTMTPVATAGGNMQLVANKRLPIFGNFQTVANVTPCDVNAAYCADRDQGQFTMSRIR